MWLVVDLGLLACAAAVLGLLVRDDDVRIVGTWQLAAIGVQVTALIVRTVGFVIVNFDLGCQPFSVEMIRLFRE